MEVWRRTPAGPKQKQGTFQEVTMEDNKKMIETINRYLRKASAKQLRTVLLVLHEIVKAPCD